MTFALIQVDPFVLIGTYNDVPDPLRWPNGDATHGVTVPVAHAGFMLVPCSYGPERPDPYSTLLSQQPEFDGSRVLFRQAWKHGDVTEIKAMMITKIDETAEGHRLRYLTQGSCQAIVYREKLAEARAYILEKSPSTSDYPLLAATIGIDGPTLSAVASAVVAAAAQWKAASAKIEKVRAATKAEIKKATTVNEIIAACHDVEWP